tara:strand:+ start:31964 stop:33922 length:1959 start_codon:yes stop_codon:yes gene_type:complete
LIVGEIMPGQKVSSFGSWESVITSDFIVKETVGLSEIKVDQGDIYWIETRPSEKGRNVLVKYNPEGVNFDITSNKFSVRSRVHEYGGGSVCVNEGFSYFVNNKDQLIYKQFANNEPKQVSEKKNRRYSDLVFDKHRDHIISVRESHVNSENEPLNEIVFIDINNASNEKVIVSGNDFYSNPRISPDGKSMSWISWDHPNMPWDGNELWIADLDSEGILFNERRIISDQESVFQPEWSPNGILYFVSDRNGWWNLFRYNKNQIEIVLEEKAEFGSPMWVFGMSNYVFATSDLIISQYTKNGYWYIGKIDLKNNTLENIELGEMYDMSRGNIEIYRDKIYFAGGSVSKVFSIFELDINTKTLKTLKTSMLLDISLSYISEPESITFKTSEGSNSHAFFYPPCSMDYVPNANEKPPLIVILHGGPTGAASITLNMEVQFWTSRGFSVLDVNYRGSTGYGTEYRKALNGKWGIVDVEDCINGVQHLINKNIVDKNRIIIRGGSAGGFTVMAALARSNVFAAGASYYGVSDLEGLLLDTHKFESNYLNTLIAPFPENKDEYYHRSPLNNVKSINTPMIIFQGLKDKIVPPSQSEKILKSLIDNGNTVASIFFDDEQHGFRNGENIKKALDAELYFYSKVLKIDLLYQVEPIEIINYQ